MSDHNQKERFTTKRPSSRYATIKQRLERAISEGLLPPGLVVNEDPIARLFGTSRTPVRKALNELETSKYVKRFNGRGFIVSGASTPIREMITRGMLGLTKNGMQSLPPMSADRITRDFEASLARALPFGQFRVHEQAAADYFEVSRTIIRELLSRFQDRGLVKKDKRSHWVLGPLTARDIKHYFAIRSQLEPLALMDSAPFLKPFELEEYLRHARSATNLEYNLKPEKIEAFERDLHISLISKTPNTHLLRMLHQSQIALSINKVFAETLGTRPFRAALIEHCMVFELLSRGSWRAGSEALREHLELSAARTQERLMSFSVFPQPDFPNYLRSIPV